MIEETFPDHFKVVAYHPSAYVYAWKRKDLEKLFEELSMSNIAIKQTEVWVVEDAKVTLLVPLRSGAVGVYSKKINSQEDEEWSDFVERSIKETTQFINQSDVDKTVDRERVDSIWYHFEFAQD